MKFSVFSKPAAPPLLKPKLKLKLFLFRRGTLGFRALRAAAMTRGLAARAARLTRRGFLRRRFLLGSNRLFRRRAALGGLGTLGSYRRRFRGLEALPVEGDLGDAHGGVRLPVSAQLLVLLFALVVEDQHLVAAALFQHLADDAGFALRLAEFTLVG